MGLYTSMKNIILNIPFIFLFFCSYVAFAQLKATTDDGRRVVLKSDSTWEFEKDLSQKPKISNFDFRKCKWGMSKKQVKATESGRIERDDETVLAYSGKVSDMNCLIAYIFVENKLVRAKYAFIPKHSNQNDYILDYKNVKENLIKKYGEPISDDSYWRDKLYQDDISQWGFAISLGHLRYSALWETESSEIFLDLSGENYHVDLASEYTSKQYKGLEEKAKEKKSKDEF
jgi:hypothetical protein